MLVRYSNRKRLFPTSGPIKEKSHETSHAQRSPNPHGLSSRRREWDVIIARMKADMTKLLYPPMHEACTFVSPMRKTVF